MPAIETQLRKRLNTLRIVRTQFRDVLALPLKRAMLARSPLATAQAIWQLPAEAAAAGFQITMLQDDQGWQVTLSRAIDTDTTIEAAGEAQSLLKALFQLVDFTQEQITKREADTRHQLAQMEVAANVAA